MENLPYLIILSTIAYAVYKALKPQSKISKSGATKLKPDVVSNDFSANLPRGLRNNNVGNIRKTNEKWQGLSASQTDLDFFQFKSMEYGNRALAKLLINYHKKGYNTLQKILSRYAPSNENHTANYIVFVSDRVGIHSTKVIKDINVILPELMHAIAVYENGVHYEHLITMTDIQKGIALVNPVIEKLEVFA